MITRPYAARIWKGEKPANLTVIIDPASSFGLHDYPYFTFRLFLASDLDLGPDQLTVFDDNSSTCGNVCFTFPSDPDTAYADPVTAAPEPGSLVLLGSALVSLGVNRRRKRKAA